MRAKIFFKQLPFLIMIVLISACSSMENQATLEELTATATIEPTLTASPTFEATQTATATGTAVPPCPTTAIPLPTLSSEYMDLDPESTIRAYFKLYDEGRFIMSYQLLSDLQHDHKSGIIQYINNGEEGLINHSIHDIVSTELKIDMDTCRVYFVKYTLSPDPIKKEGWITIEQYFDVVKEEDQWRILDWGAAGNIFTCRDYIENTHK